MPNLRFSRLYLLSQNEQAGLEISFNRLPTIVRAPNNHGKSAVLKSLYDAFGAQPHKIDNSWKSANAISLVEFTIDGEEYAILKTAGSYSVFDAKKKPLITTSKVTDELGPFLANLLNFKLVMIDRDDRVRIPPPAYIFAPFYVDQDQGWIKSWASFSRMYLPDSARLLSEYHSGIRSNDYYEAVAERNRLRAALQEITTQRDATSEAIKKIREATSEITLSYDLSDFSRETDRLVANSQGLHNKQVSHREELAALNEEFQLWTDQRAIINGAIAEMDSSLSHAAAHPSHVECPTCGQDYDNDLRAQFGLVEDIDGLLTARLNASRKISEIDVLIKAQRNNLAEIEKAILEADSIFAVRKAEVTFKDVVRAEGRTEAARLLQSQLEELDTRIGKLNGEIAEQEGRIRSASSRTRSDQITSEFFDLLATFSKSLDARLEDGSNLKLSGVNIGRGSEGPRALLAYYFAFLTIARKYSSCAFCPIVIDAPNQQGQDKKHMPAMMRFMLDQAPEGSQLIIGAEDQYGLHKHEIDIIDVSGQKDHVLRIEQFENVSNSVRPYLARIL